MWLQVYVSHSWSLARLEHRRHCISMKVKTKTECWLLTGNECKKIILSFLCFVRVFLPGLTLAFIVLNWGLKSAAGKIIIWKLGRAKFNSTIKIFLQNVEYKTNYLSLISLIAFRRNKDSKHPASFTQKQAKLHPLIKSRLSLWPINIRKTQRVASMFVVFLTS